MGIRGRDLRPRRRRMIARSDRGKRRKLFKGKRPKTKRRIKFERRRGNKTEIKLRWMEKRKMSLRGWRAWNPKIRPKMHPYTYHWGSVVLTPVIDISNREDIEEWALTAIGYPGFFYVMGLSKTFKNKWQRKWVKMFSITIKETKDGLRAKFQRDFRMFRYWYWQKNQ